MLKMQVFGDVTLFRYASSTSSFEGLGAFTFRVKQSSRMGALVSFETSGTAPPSPHNLLPCPRFRVFGQASTMTSNL